MTGPDWTERFWAKVDKNGPSPARGPDLGPCWIWTASLTTRGGYGQFSLNRKPRKAYQLAYEMKYGRIPEGTEPDHLCRVHACVNWDHLEAVPRRVNFLRGEHPTAVSVRTNRCFRGHEFTPQNTYTKPGGSRQCRSCMTARQRERRIARRAA